MDDVLWFTCTTYIVWFGFLAWGYADFERAVLFLMNLRREQNRREDSNHDLHSLRSWSMTIYCGGRLFSRNFIDIIISHLFVTIDHDTSIRIETRDVVFIRISILNSQGSISFVSIHCSYHLHCWMNRRTCTDRISNQSYFGYRENLPIFSYWFTCVGASESAEKSP